MVVSKREVETYLSWGINIKEYDVEKRFASCDRRRQATFFLRALAEIEGDIDKSSHKKYFKFCTRLVVFINPIITVGLLRFEILSGRLIDQEIMNTTFEVYS